MTLLTPALANDKYRATLRSTYIDGTDTTLNVTAIPANLPTNVTVGWNTTYETEFRVTGTSGTNSSNYALTGITKTKGYTGNIPENSAVNCLNNEDFFNQWGAQIAAIQEVADAAISPDSVSTLTNKRITKRVFSETSNATPTPDIDSYDAHHITAQAAAAAFGAPTGTPTSGQPLIIRIKDNGTARALTFNAIYRFSTDLPAPTTTVISKVMYLGFLYNGTDTKWDCLAVLGNF